MSNENRSKFEQAAGDQPPPGLVAELWSFLVQNKKWWLMPILLVLSMLGLLLVLAGTGAAPFIYTLF
jgi:hypothetical protein